MAAIITCQGSAHDVLHHLHLIAETFEDYPDPLCDEPDFNPALCSLHLTKILPGGATVQVSLELEPKFDANTKKLRAFVAHPHPDPRAVLVETLGPLVLAHLEKYPQPDLHITVNYDA